MAGGVLTLDVYATHSSVSFSEFLVPALGSYTVVLDERVGASGFSTSIFELISQGASGGPGFCIGYDGVSEFRITRLGDNYRYPLPSGHQRAPVGSAGGCRHTEK